MSSARERVRTLRDRLPIRWKVAGASALLTLTILLAFAVVVGLMAGRQLRSDFEADVASAADGLGQRLHVEVSGDRRVQCTGVDLQDYARAEDAIVRVLLTNGQHLCGPSAPQLGFPRQRPTEVAGERVETRIVPLELEGRRAGIAVAQYARPLSDLERTVRRVRVLLLLGVLGGAGLALLAGLAIARRAMTPIARLTETAREIERTRNPGRRIEVPDRKDEVAELARTLDGMLLALDAARGETEHALARQKRFVADASHELRTPLTSVLANLELLAAELEGEPRETAESALRSTRRMRRLVADLLLLARADAGREAPHAEVDLARVLVDAAGELGPVADDHPLEVAADVEAGVLGAPDELHRLVLNLLENANAHTPRGTAVRASVAAGDGRAVLAVEDDGPGIPAELRERIFDRFVRGGGDAGGGTGLGLAIVRAVAERHGGTVSVGTGRDGRGARFAVSLPLATVPVAAEPSPSPV